MSGSGHLRCAGENVPFAYGRAVRRYTVGGLSEKKIGEKLRGEKRTLSRELGLERKEHELDLEVKQVPLPEMRERLT